jgi:hypothetical protein
MGIRGAQQTSETLQTGAFELNLHSFMLPPRYSPTLLWGYEAGFKETL